MKVVLVTGAGGFVGQHLVGALSRNYQVISATHHPAGALESANVSYRQLDIRDRDAVDRLLKQQAPDFIIHLAASTTGWFEDPKALYETNLFGTLNLYEAIAKLKEENGYNPKILYVGSSEAYGMSSSVEPITEDAPFLPANNYGASKACADVASYAYTRSKGLNIIIARPFTHTGPGQREGFFVSDMVAQVVKAEQSGGSELRVGNTDATRDYLDVRDVVRAYVLLLESDTAAGAAYNVCSGRGVKIKDLLNQIIKLSTVSLSLVQDPARMRPSDVPIFVGDNSKLHALTGWQPTFSLQQTISDALAYRRLESVTPKTKKEV